jgi:hypothetical protein
MKDVTITGKLIQVLGHWMVRTERTSDGHRHWTGRLVGVKPHENVLREFYQLRNRRVTITGATPAHSFVIATGIREVDDDHPHPCTRQS